MKRFTPPAGVVHDRPGAYGPDWPQDGWKGYSGINAHWLVSPFARAIRGVPIFVGRRLLGQRR